jgi:hypothetical protein
LQSESSFHALDGGASSPRHSSEMKGLAVVVVAAAVAFFAAPASFQY